MGIGCEGTIKETQLPNGLKMEYKATRLHHFEIHIFLARRTVFRRVLTCAAKAKPTYLRVSQLRKLDDKFRAGFH